MPSNTVMVLWALTTLAELLAAYIFLLWGMAREFRFFTYYLAFSFATSVVSYAVIEHYGFSSLAYWKCFSVGKALGTVMLYLSIAELVVRTARSPRGSKRLVGLFLAGLVAAILLSDGLTFSQRVFASVEKLFWLGGAIVGALSIRSFFEKNRDSHGRSVGFGLVRVMGVYFFLYAAAYGLIHLSITMASIWVGLGSLASAWLPIGASLVAMSAPPSG